jgi:hypothetical protein
VHDERYIVFRDHVRSLSDAALEVAHEKGFLWKAVQGPRAWKFGDALLDDLRNELAGADDGGESGLA